MSERTHQRKGGSATQAERNKACPPPRRGPSGVARSRLSRQLSGHRRASHQSPRAVSLRNGPFLCYVVRYRIKTTEYRMAGLAGHRSPLICFSRVRQSAMGRDVLGPGRWPGSERRSTVWAPLHRKAQPVDCNMRLAILVEAQERFRPHAERFDLTALKPDHSQRHCVQMRSTFAAVTPFDVFGSPSTRFLLFGSEPMQSGPEMLSHVGHRSSSP